MSRPVQRLERPFLHAARLAFTHPPTAGRWTFESPLPDDLRTVIDEISDGRIRPRRTGTSS